MKLFKRKNKKIKWQPKVGDWVWIINYDRIPPCAEKRYVGALIGDGGVDLYHTANSHIGKCYFTKYVFETDDEALDYLDLRA